MPFRPPRPNHSRRAAGVRSALAQGQWPAYAGTYAAARYSPLTQINRDNAKNLRVIWRWKSPDAAIRDAKPEIGPGFVNELTPLMVDGVLYTSTSLSQVAAIDAVTGETKWLFDPKIYENGLGPPANLGWTHRGVAYWRKGSDERIVILTAFAQMIALDAKTGTPVPDFGTNGRVDLKLGLRRPPSTPFLHHDLAAGDRARCHRGRLLRARLVGRAAVAGRRRQGLRHRAPASNCGPSIRWRRARSPAPRPGRTIPERPATPMSGRR